MIKIGDYLMEYNISTNHIDISLPSTYETIRSTVVPISTTRKIELSDKDLLSILGLVVKIFENR